jgi:hypothetical protein
MVEPDMNLLVVKDASGVPFNFTINRFARSGTRTVSSGLRELKCDVSLDGLRSILTGAAGRCCSINQIDAIDLGGG